MPITEVEIVDMPMELTVFDPLDAQIAEAKEKNANLVFDYEDKKGNKEARSWVAHLRKFKAPVSEMHKTGKAEALKYCKAWDDAKNKRIAAIEEMIEVHYAPIRAIEEREEAKRKAEEERIQREKEESEAKRQAEIEAREAAIREKEEQLRKERAEIERKEREARIAEEARQKAAAEAKQALIDAENRRLADIEREKEKARLELEAKERAIREQKEREETERKQQEAEEKARIEDQEHRKQVHKEIYEAIIQLGILPQDAKCVGAGIAAGKVPHVRIEY